MKVMNHLKLWGWPLIGAILVFSLRFSYLAQGPGSWDDVDFALALQQFDIARMQPHFPGYPIYILVATIVRKLVTGDFMALSVLSAISNALTVFPIFFIFRNLFGIQVALLVSLFWAASPLSMVLGSQPMSDSFGAFMALLVIAASVVALDSEYTERIRAVALISSGILLGLLYGVRVSYLMIGMVPLWAGYIYFRDTREWKDCVTSILSLFLTCLLWGYTLAVNVGGWDALWKLGLKFTEGHFTDWGGTYHGNDSFVSRLSYWVLRQWFAAGIGTPWTHQHQTLTSYGVLAGAIVALYYTVKHLYQKKSHWDLRWAGLLLAWGIPYMLWAFFAQNAEKPRHLLPIFPLLLCLLAIGLAQAKKMLIAGLLAICMFSVGWSQVQSQNQIPSPMEQLADYLADPAISKNSITFTYEEERVIRFKYPEISTVRLRTLRDFQISILNQPALPEHIFITNYVIEGFNNPQLLSYVKEVARFSGTEWLYPTYHTIVLYEISPQQLDVFMRLKD